MIKNVDADNSKYTWDTPATGALSHEKMEAAEQRTQDIVDFITSWENLDSKFYNQRQGRAKLLKPFKHIVRMALQNYYWEDNMGVFGMTHHKQDKTW
jgi:hypothetical protein